MKNSIYSVLCFCVLFNSFASAQTIHPTLAIGAKAPDFKLKGVDDKDYTLASFRQAKVLVILFTCNHCPTAQAYEDRVIQFTKDYQDKGVSLVAISPNADKAVRWDELGYTDLSDSFEELKLRAKDKGYNFPYLYDGETQEIANLYGPVATPHVFVFDQDRVLQYSGRIDDNEHIGKEKTHELRDAVDALLEGKEVSPKTTKTFGCSIKWLSKAVTVVSEVESWASEPVGLAKANVDTLKKIMKNEGTGKYRLINVWATWCGPCVAEFSSLVQSNHMYKRRDFEFITLSADAPKNEAKVLSFLKSKYASNQNYLFDGGSKYDMIEAIDPNWQGALPYTVLIDPKGKKVFQQMGMIDIRAVRKAIADNVGRYYD